VLKTKAEIIEAKHDAIRAYDSALFFRLEPVALLAAAISPECG